jgi:CheY-like chemotaxis protein
MLLERVMAGLAKVLIVDDDVDFLRIARLTLERAGFDVLIAYSGQEGRVLARDARPDLIVLDAVMETPTEGFTMVEDLRGDPDLKHVPIVMLTSINQMAYPWHFDKDSELLPVDRFLDKPVTSERLVAEVAKALPHR